MAAANPLVSVIIPTYNCASYLPEAIDSVLAQKYSPVETIVVDDGSTDDTSGILRRYKGRILVVAQTNRGVSAACNAGIRRASGKLVAFLGADDLWMPEHVALAVDALRSYPEAVFSFTDGVEFDERGIIRDSLFSPDHKPFHEWSRRYRQGSSPVSVGPFYEELLFHNNYVIPSTVVVRREALERVGMFDETLGFAEDYDLSLRLARWSPVVFLDGKMLRKRVLATSLCGPSDVRLARCRYYAARVAERYIGSVTDGVRRKAKSQIAGRFLMAGWNYMNLDQLPEARAAFWNSWRIEPWRLRVLVYLVTVMCLSPLTIRRVRLLLAQLRGKRDGEGPLPHGQQGGC